MEAKKPDKDKENEEDNEEDIDYDLLSKEEKEEKLQQRFIECLNSFNTNAISECIDYLEQLPFSVINYVLSKTSGIKTPNWNYAKTILDDYVKRKINNLEKVKLDDLKYKNKENRKQNISAEEEFLNEYR